MRSIVSINGDTKHHHLLETQAAGRHSQILSDDKILLINSSGSNSIHDYCTRFKKISAIRISAVMTELLTALTTKTPGVFTFANLTMVVTNKHALITGGTQTMKIKIRQIHKAFYKANEFLH